MNQTITSDPLNILQIASGFPGWGGTELHILNLSQQLTLRGHNVVVACRDGGWVHKRASEMGLRTLAATVQRQQDWQDYGVFASFLRANRIDVVHTHWSTDAFVPSFAARMAGVPVRVMSRHSPYPFKTPLGRLLYTRFLYNRIVTVSQSVANTLIACGVPSSKITVVHHGTNVAEFERITKDRANSRAELGLTSDMVAVGILGRIAEEKGHRFLFDALALLPDLANLRVVVVGDGPQAAEQREYVEHAGLGERVIWVPFRTDVNNVINALDIVTVPSTWEEPCSAVIQQAMALSKPVIGTRVGGTPEMIVDRETGLLAHAKSAEELAGAIRTLALDEGLRVRQGAAGAERVRALFTLDHMTDRIVEIYREHLGPAGKARVATTADPQREAARRLEAGRIWGTSAAMLISVIIPAYNAAGFLGRTVASVQRQSLTEWECIVVDDGSADATFDVARSVAAQDARVRAVLKANGGVASARNRGLAESSQDGEYILFLDHDDELEPDALATMSADLIAHPDFGACHGLALECSAGGKSRLRNEVRQYVVNGRVTSAPTDLPTSPAMLAWDNCITTTGCVLFRRAALARYAAPFDPAMVPLDDWDFYFRFSMDNPVRFLKTVVVRWNVHATNTSLAAASMDGASLRVLSRIASCNRLAPDIALAAHRRLAGLRRTATRRRANAEMAAATDHFRARRLVRAASLAATGAAHYLMYLGHMSAPRR